MSSIDQLWYTASPVGLGTTGFQVRAASPGLRDPTAPRFRLVEGLIRYEIPLGTVATSLRPEDAPVTLALLQNNRERIIIHRAFVGLTWDRRPGNFFTHLLAGVPAHVHPLDVIESWGSSFWRRDDTGLERGRTDLPPADLASLRAADSPASSDVSKIKPEHLVYVIQSYLNPGESQRLYLAAPPDVVAVLIWALLKALPRPMTARLRFSTYEQDVTKATALTSPTLLADGPMIVGTCYAHGADQAQAGAPLLPPAFFEAQSRQVRVFNTYSGKFSPADAEQRILDYAAFATKCLLVPDGQRARLATLIAIAESRMSPDDGLEHQLKTLLSVYRFFAADGVRPLSRDDITDLLSQSWLAVDVLGQPAVRQKLLRLVLSEPGWWKAFGASGVVTVTNEARSSGKAEHQAALTSLLDEAATALEEAVRKHNVDAASAALELIRRIDRQRADNELQGLLARLSELVTSPEIQRYPVRLRLWLLNEWGGLPLTSEQERQYERWLEVPWIDIGHILGDSRLPAKRKEDALILGIKQGEPLPPAFGRDLAAKPDRRQFVEQVMSKMAHGTERCALAPFYVQLVRTGYPERGQLLEKLLPYLAAYPPEYDKMLGVANLPPIEAFKLIKASRNTHRDLLAQPSVHALLKPMMQGITIKRAMEEWELLDIVSQCNGLPQERDLAMSWVAVCNFLQSPSADWRSLKLFASALSQLPDQDVAGPPPWLVEVLAPLPRTSNELREIVTKVGEHVGQGRMVHVGRGSAGATWQLLIDLLSYLLKHERRDPYKIAPYAEIVFSYSAPPHAICQEAKDRLSKSDKSVYEAIELAAVTWDESTKAQWNRFARITRPKSLLDRIGSFWGRGGSNLLLWSLAVVLVLMSAGVVYGLYLRYWPGAGPMASTVPTPPLVVPGVATDGNIVVPPIDPTGTRPATTPTGVVERTTAPALIVVQSGTVFTTTASLPYYFAPDLDASKLAGTYAVGTVLTVKARYNGPGNWIHVMTGEGAAFWVEADRAGVAPNDNPQLLPVITEVVAAEPEAENN